MSHDDQIQRIKTKLLMAHQADTQYKVFGAASHQYQIGRPASEKEVRAFEEQHALELPACYRAFVTGVGNGGMSSNDAGAGPFYGIYPLGKLVGGLFDDAALYLNKPAIIKPDMTDDAWAALTRRLDETDNFSDADFEAEMGRIYAGVLPIGSQGCSYLHTLVVTGPCQGRVVNLDMERSKPKFAYENNFLDWYERWLDEVISGVLKQGGPSWFGYTMGGDDEHLMRVYDANADTRTTRMDALEGLGKLKSATEASCRKLLELCGHEDADTRRLALRMLAKFDYSLARAPLHTHLVGNDDDCLAACQSIHWYARKHVNEWTGVLRSRLPAIHAPETFRFMAYLLVEAGVDFTEDFRPFCTHQNEDIRETAFYSLGKLKHKGDLLDLFILGLDDTAPRVVSIVLQALDGVRDERLLPAYARIVNRFEADEYCPMGSLEHRLKEMGFGSLEKFRESLAR